MSGHTVWRYAPGPFAQRIGLTTFGLTLLFALLAPEASEPLGFPARLVFWALHIGIGLWLCELAAELMLRLAPGLRDWRLIVLSGLIGIVMFAPIALGLESLFPVGDAAGPDGELAGGIAARSLIGAIAVEALEAAPPFLATWFVINTEPLAAALRRDDGGPSTRSYSLAKAATDHDVEETAAAAPDVAPAPERVAPGREAADAGFASRLPRAIGTDVLAVSSDLHYLQVVTRLGRAMILGTLQEVEQAYGNAGLRIHRSHWVRADAVARLRQSGDQWRVELVNGDRLPVSCRKRSAVSQRIGKDFARDLAG